MKDAQWNPLTHSPVATESKARAIREPDSRPAGLAFGSGLIFLTLGVTFSSFAMAHWGHNQQLTLLSGMVGVYLGVRSLVKYIGLATEDQE